MARIRTFLSIELTSSIRDRIVMLQNRLAATGADVKWTDAKNLHVTLLFLGEVPDKEVATVYRIAQKAVEGMGEFTMTVEGFGCFPNPRRPRILWVGIGQGTQELVRIHDALEEPLVDLGYRREDRKYTPHITLGRVRSARPAERLTQALHELTGWSAGEMTVEQVHVMGSELTPTGPVYTVLGRAPLA